MRIWDDFLLERLASCRTTAIKVPVKPYGSVEYMETNLRNHIKMLDFSLKERLFLMEMFKRGIKYYYPK